MRQIKQKIFISVMSIVTFEIIIKLSWNATEVVNDDLRKSFKISSNFSKRIERVNLECSRLARNNKLRSSYIEPQNFITLERS